MDAGTQAFAIGLNEEWKKSRVRCADQDYRVFFEHYRNRLQPSFLLEKIQGDSLQKLVETAKSNAMTVNEIVAAAFSQATMEILGRNEIRLGVAANIRHELVAEPNHCMGNYVTGIVANVSDLSQDFIVNAQTTAKALREQLANLKSRHLAVHFLQMFDKDLIESIMYAAYGPCEHPVSKKLAELMGERPDNKGVGISNLGHHRIQTQNIQVLDIRFIGPAFPANRVTVGLITANDALNLCLRYNATETNAETAQRIMKRGVELLCMA